MNCPRRSFSSFKCKSSGFKRSIFLFRSDLLAHKVCRATEELVQRISMHFIQPHHLRNVSVETRYDVKTYVQE